MPPTSGNLVYRVDTLEKDMQDIKTQIRQAPSDQVYSFRFQAFEDKLDTLNQNMRDILVRIDQDRNKTMEEFKSIRDSLSRIQISALVAGIIFFLGIVSSVVVVLLTHNITH